MTESNLLEQLQQAQAQLASYESAWETYAGKNPDGLRADISNTAIKVRQLTASCKAQGLIERSPQEALHARLDAAFADVANKKVVHFEGAFFRRKFQVGAQSASRNTVTEWLAVWEDVSADSDEAKKLLDPNFGAEQQDRNKLIVKHWPFKRPAGGIKLTFLEGEPALAGVSLEKISVSYGSAAKRCLVASITATADVIALMRSTPKAPEDAKPALFLGLNSAGQRVSLRKRGAGFEGLYLSTEE